MWTCALVRILRSKLVLTIILGLSTLYCLVSFLQEGDRNTIDRDVDSPNPRLSFLWHAENDNDNQTGTEVTSCRNSVQGREQIVDDKGYICARGDVLATGCCNVEAEGTRRYSCDTCQPSGCCSVYEYCISCCLHPDKKEVLEAVLGEASENVLFASVTDHFELCLAKCRTSSQSVHHENSYRDPQAKHCYSQTPSTDAQPS